MKGLYCRAGLSDAELKFIIQDATLSDVLDSHQVRVQVKACGLSPVDLKFLGDLGIQNDVIPVGRDVAGVVLQVGPKVSFFQPGDEVVGILPVDTPCSGLCSVIDMDEHCLVQKAEKLSWVCVAGALRDGVCAYTALHTLAHMAAGHTLLVLDGASPFGLMCIQLACYHGVKVLTTSHSPQDHTFLEQLRPTVARVIPVYSAPLDLLPAVLEETGGLGVDIVIDSGVRLQEEGEPEERKLLPHKHDIISVLGVGAHWVTSHQDLQLDPPDCRMLFLKSATVSFLNAEIWLTSSAQKGRYLHILRDIVEKMSSGVLRPQPEEAVPLYEATVAMETIQRQQKRKTVVQL
ncbi:quinone oxidoreductase-like protein 1 isoform X2 [Thalassophryne amazonica]|uniref:quinone oxidoreductase-like protein 1 isoform X2 n=1 Tax=Thalassophryne amazonica TaxID=390379 RepID=UPI001470C06F|nr:quinone oxidoreductase-like protein 1 isoform X2 [Thalassophryne amazonica]